MNLSRIFLVTADHLLLKCVYIFVYLVTLLSRDFVSLSNGEMKTYDREDGINWS